MISRAADLTKGDVVVNAAGKRRTIESCVPVEWFWRRVTFTDGSTGFYPYDIPFTVDPKNQLHVAIAKAAKETPCADD